MHCPELHGTKCIMADAVQAVIKATCMGPKAVVEAYTYNVCMIDE